MVMNWSLSAASATRLRPAACSADMPRSVNNRNCSIRLASTAASSCASDAPPAFQIRPSAKSAVPSRLCASNVLATSPSAATAVLASPGDSRPAATAAIGSKASTSSPCQSRNREATAGVSAPASTWMQVPGGRDDASAAATSAAALAGIMPGKGCALSAKTSAIPSAPPASSCRQAAASEDTSAPSTRWMIRHGCPVVLPVIGSAPVRRG